MSAFTEVAFLKKLAELNSSQQSIQTLSLWLIHHRKHHASIVKTWLRELQNGKTFFGAINILGISIKIFLWFIVPEAKKLTFMYLANDVIQNSKKKGPEYGKEYSNALPKAFSHIGETCKGEKLFGSLGRILNIWEERGVYEPKNIGDFRNRLNKEHGKVGSTTAAPSATKEIVDEKRESKRKHDEHKSKSKKSRVSPAEETSSELNGDGDQSPYLPLGEPPEPEDLIKALVSIENSASSDAAVRERIANLPPEISEISCLAKLEDKDAAKNLATQVSAKNL